MTKSAPHIPDAYRNGQNASHTPTLKHRPHTWTPRVHTPYIRSAPGRLNLQCTSLMLSVFVHSFAPLPFSNSVLDYSNWLSL